MNEWHELSEEFKSLPTDATLRFVQNGDEPAHWQLRCDYAPYHGRWLALANRAGALLGDDIDPAVRWWEHMAAEFSDLTENHRSLYPCHYDDRVNEPFQIVSWELPQLRGRCERACSKLSTQTAKPPVEQPKIVETPAGASVNARMLDIMLRNPDSRGWTARQWAGELGCGASTVAETKTWKELDLIRKKLRADARQDRRRRMDKPI